MTVYDGSILDSYGDDTKLTLQANSAAVDANPNSWYYAAGTVYIRTSDDRAPDTDLHYYYAAYSVQCTRDSKVIYLENIKYHGAQGAYFNSASATGGLKVYALNCHFKYAQATGFNSFLCQGVTEVIVQGCIASKADEDGFHYNALNGINTRAIEIDCQGYDNGHAGYVYNGSSAHGDCETVRINGEYHHNRGTNIHDIGNGKTWMLGTEAHHPEPVSPSGNYTKNNFTCGFGSTGFSQWMDGCYSHDTFATGFDLAVDFNGVCKVEDFTSGGLFSIGGTKSDYDRVVTGTTTDTPLTNPERNLVLTVN